jgi:ABC-type transport system involved in cytochrome bd biosynthesis fused ATPase/permease subunit
VETLENFYVRVVVPPLAAALGVAFACAIVGAFGWSLALVLLLFLLLTGMALPLIMRRLGKETAAGIIAARSELNAVLVDEVQGVADLLCSTRTGGIAEGSARVESSSGYRSGWRSQGASNALSLVLGGLAALAVLGLAIPLVTGGAVEPVYLALLPLTAMASFEAVQPLARPATAGGEPGGGRRIFELIARAGGG